MTICIGMLASDGIVIAADAQESDNYFKRSQQKILTWGVVGLSNSGPARGASHVSCVLTGAGDAGFIDAFSQNLLHALKPDLTMHSFEEILADRLEEFYGKHVIPVLASDPNADFRMLIGAYFGFSSRLYVTYRSTLRVVMPYAAIGVGGSFASRLMDESPLISSVRETEVMAANVIAVTKDCIEGCGKYTDVVSIHNCSIVEGTQPGEGSHLEHSAIVTTRVSPMKIARWEKSFGSQWANRQRKLTQELICEEIKNDEQIETVESLKRLDAHTLEGQQ